MEPLLPAPEPASAPPPPPTSLAGRLMSVFAAPGDVFDEIKTAPPRLVNWLVPIGLMAAVGVISCFVMFAQPNVRQTIHEQQVKALDQRVQEGKMTQAQEDQALQVMEKFMGPAVLAVLGSIAIVIYSFVSLFGWALVLWLAGQWFFKVRCNYLKILEAVGLSSVITAFGMVISTLLIVILGRLYVGPSLALLVSNFDPNSRGHLLLGAVNGINLWHAGVLAVVLAKFSNRPMPKAIAIVYGFWVLIELLLIAIGLGQWAL